MSGYENTLPDARLRASISQLTKWIERNNYRGYEPFDGLSSAVRPLLFGSIFAERVLMQIIRRSPVNLRPLLGVSKKESTKGRGYIAAGYLTLGKLGDADALQKADMCLDWLDKHKVERFDNHAWSNHFDFASRAGRYTSQDPIIVWTALIGHTFVDAFEQTGKERYLEVAKSAARWILSLPREKTESGDCISYLYDVQSSIHNSNMLGAAFLSRVNKHDPSEEKESVARKGMEYSCSRIREDGSWYYGEAEKYHWVDNFHTGYNLDSLYYFQSNLHEPAYDELAQRAMKYYVDTMFRDDGAPRYYDKSLYPIDIQCCAQAVETLTMCREWNPGSFELANRVAAWTLDNMQSKNGYFYYRKGSLYTIKTPMLHWGQGTMFKALAKLAEARQVSI